MQWERGERHGEKCMQWARGEVAAMGTEAEGYMAIMAYV